MPALMQQDTSPQQYKQDGYSNDRQQQRRNQGPKLALRAKWINDSLLAPSLCHPGSRAIYSST